MATPTTLAPMTSGSAAPIPSPTTFTATTSSSPIVTYVPVSMTTPYVYPPSCSNIFEVYEDYGLTHRFAKIQETYLFVNTRINGSENHWNTCLPRGVGQVESPERAGYVYKAAVCPSGWMAYSVGYETITKWGTGTNKNDLITKTISTAACCMSGDSYDLDMWNLSYQPRPYNTGYPPPRVCVSSPQNGDDNRHDTHHPSITLTSDLTLGVSIFTTTSTHIKYSYDRSAATYFTDPIWTTVYTLTRTQGTEVTVTNTVQFIGRAFYPAMSMEWEASDNASLDPQWPTLTSDVLVPSWAPGVSIYPGYENKGKGHDYSADEPKPPANIRMKIAIPIIATLGGIIVSAILYIMYRRICRALATRREQKEKEAVVDFRNNSGPPLELADMGRTESLDDREENVVPLEREEVVRKKKGTRVGRWWRRHTTGEGVVPRVDERERELPLSDARRV